MNKLVDYKLQFNTLNTTRLVSVKLAEYLDYRFICGTEKLLSAAWLILEIEVKFRLICDFSEKPDTSPASLDLTLLYSSRRICWKRLTSNVFPETPMISVLLCPGVRPVSKRERY